MTPERLLEIKDLYSGSQWNGLSPQEHVLELVAALEKTMPKVAGVATCTKCGADFPNDPEEPCWCGKLDCTLCGNCCE